MFNIVENIFLYFAMIWLILAMFLLIVFIIIILYPSFDMCIENIKVTDNLIQEKIDACRLLFGGNDD